MKPNSQVRGTGIASLAGFVSSELLQAVDFGVLIWDGFSVAILKSLGYQEETPW